ncbi:hypothetical protein [Kitasatospora sp. NPDC085464]|uniref:hypothetical protein n=1 Tax=Kitasatospora sp. NPDC085464 TaxID=3364063 RepID=UPI0037C82560
MDAIFGPSPQSPLAAAVSEDWGLLLLRVPMGWHVGPGLLSGVGCGRRFDTVVPI